MLRLFQKRTSVYLFLIPLAVVLVFFFSTSSTAAASATTSSHAARQADCGVSYSNLLQTDLVTCTSGDYTCSGYLTSSDLYCSNAEGQGVGAANPYYSGSGESSSSGGNDESPLGEQIHSEGVGECLAVGGYPCF